MNATTEAPQATPTRLYLVTNKLTGDKELVEASHPGNAVRVITKNVFDVEVPSSLAIAELLESGKKVIRAPKA